jgi:F-type H+-transporting ATPase subunit b
MIEIDQSLLIQIVNFIIFLLIVNYLIFRPVVRVLDDRHQRIDGTMEQAQSMEGEIEKRLEEYETRIQEAKSQAANEKEGLRREAERLSKEIVEKAREELARDIPILRMQIASETDRVRLELQQKAQDMSRDIACRLLGREIS